MPNISMPRVARDGGPSRPLAKMGVPARQKHCHFGSIKGADLSHRFEEAGSYETAAEESWLAWSLLDLPFGW